MFCINAGDDVILNGKAIRDINNNFRELIIPKEFTKELDIENSKASMSLLDDFGGDKHLLVTKYHNEIVIDLKDN